MKEQQRAVHEHGATSTPEGARGQWRDCMQVDIKGRSASFAAHHPPVILVLRQPRQHWKCYLIIEDPVLAPPQNLSDSGTDFILINVYDVCTGNLVTRPQSKTDTAKHTERNISFETADTDLNL